VQIKEERTVKMKIAAVSDDGYTISQHFGRASKYVIMTVDGDLIAKCEVREKVGHSEFQQEGSHNHQHHDDPRGRGFGTHSAEKHRRMFANITDCEILLARGMGQGAYRGLQEVGIRPIVTNIGDIDIAVQAVINGSIEDHPGRLH
jgi:predicted Fe-Mo cluster-binding NifX family protein